MGAGAIPIDVEKAFKKRARSSHKLQVFTADSGYAGEDCIDVSMRGGTFALVPPKHLLVEYKLGKRSQAQFREAYFEFLQGSYAQYQYTWDSMLDRDRIVLICSCNADDKTCHRPFIIEFMKKFGAVYKGKLKT